MQEKTQPSGNNAATDQSGVSPEGLQEEFKGYNLPPITEGDRSQVAEIIANTDPTTPEGEFVVAKAAEVVAVPLPEAPQAPGVAPPAAQ